MILDLYICKRSSWSDGQSFFLFFVYTFVDGLTIFGLKSPFASSMETRIMNESTYDNKKKTNHWLTKTRRKRKQAVANETWSFQHNKLKKKQQQQKCIFSFFFKWVNIQNQNRWLEDQERKKKTHTIFFVFCFVQKRL